MNVLESVKLNVLERKGGWETWAPFHLACLCGFEGIVEEALVTGNLLPRVQELGQEEEGEVSETQVQTLVSR